MQKITVTLSFDDEKLRALDTYLKMENSSVQKKLEDAMEQLYTQMVPKPVQEYLEAIGGTKAKRPATKPQAGAKPKTEPKAPGDQP